MFAASPSEIDRRTAMLSRRADSLRVQAQNLGPLVAETYRRRAAELELQAWAIKARTNGAEPLAA